MNYYGTRNKENFYSLYDAAKSGLAPCRGLYMPESIPSVDMVELEKEAEKSYAHMAFYVADKIFGQDMDKELLRNIVFDAYNFDIPVLELGKSGIYTLELFHGPTLAFKDFGARFMSRMLSAICGDKKMIILTATSGDTGSAVADGFYGIDGIDVHILFPEGKISDFQERQMTTLGKNIYAYRVDGTFDDCQAMVKEIFADHKLCAEKNITSANSISILRWIPQSFYYFWAYVQWKKQTGKTECDVVVPSGNFGNITAAIFAHKMGMPVKRFIAAVNANDTMVKFLNEGIYQAKPSIQTVANAMDVGDPSNYERLIELFDAEQLKDKMFAVSYSDDQIKDAMKELYEKYNYISDPHSAVGYLAYKAMNADGYYVSTAHNSKFASVVKDALNIDVAIPDTHKHIMTKEKIFGHLKRDELLNVIN